jgi:TetR/AcrR family transcriptional regulator, cholesterol catabolism regulator
LHDLTARRQMVILTLRSKLVPLFKAMENTPPDATVSLRARKKAATKERIFYEALDLFRQKGFSATTVEEIAEAADVSKGTFFNYYPTKEALLHFLGERQTLATSAELEAALHDARLSTRQKLSRILTGLANHVEADRELTRVAVFEFLKVPAAIVADPYRNLFRQTVTALLGEGQRRGDVTAGVDAELLSSAITGVYFQQIFEWCAAEAPYPLARRLDAIIDMLWAGVGRVT